MMKMRVRNSRSVLLCCIDSEYRLWMPDAHSGVVANTGTSIGESQIIGKPLSLYKSI